MGGTSGVPDVPEIPVITKEVFMKLTGVIYSESLFNLMRNKDGIIEKETFISFVDKITDVFISHDWGEDELQRSNHDRASRFGR